jgi:taurine dioxygenase
MGQITVKPLGYALGAEVQGVDMRASLAADDRKAINAAWLKHCVLVFPGQEALTPEQQIAFAGQFGELDQHASQPPATLHPGHPEILVLTNRQVQGKPSGTRNSGRNWHTDLSYTERPAKGALLLCREKPPVGGDTMFANLSLAYETLTPRIQALIEDLEAVHDASLIKGIEQRDPAIVAEMRNRNPPVAHPLVRVHPETGRKALLIGQRIRGILGLSDEEGAALLNLLNAHAIAPEFVYRHRWSLGDVLMWDNRCTMHVALADFDQSQPRVMHRCSLQGERVTGRILRNPSIADRETLIQAVAAVA